MKSLLWGALFGLAAGSAIAADLPVKAPYAAPVMAPQFNWNGFYIGAHLGGGWEHSETNVFDTTGALVAATGTDRSGVLGGGQIGFNWTFVPRWVVGIEADISGADLKGGADACTATGCAHTDNKRDLLGTVRGRLGYAWSNMLFYGTGGWAWGNSRTDRTITCVVAGGGTCPGGPSPSVLTGRMVSSSGTDSGWAAGGGIEWAFARQWSARIEYLHYQFDNIGRDFSYAGFPNATRHSDRKDTDETVRAGVNYRF